MPANDMIKNIEGYTISISDDINGPFEGAVKIVMIITDENRSEIDRNDVNRRLVCAAIAEAMDNATEQ